MSRFPPGAYHAAVGVLGEHLDILTEHHPAWPGTVLVPTASLNNRLRSDL